MAVASGTAVRPRQPGRARPSGCLSRCGCGCGRFRGLASAPVVLRKRSEGTTSTPRPSADTSEPHAHLLEPRRPPRVLTAAPAHLDHALGYRGHILTKSRGYFTTQAALRAERAHHVGHADGS
ncbi:replication initiator [Streptomyces tendae]